MSGVEILYKALEFTFSMTYKSRKENIKYKTTAKYQLIVFLESIYSIFEMSQFKFK